MTIDVKLNNEGDLQISNYDLSLIRDLDQVIQNLSIRLRFYLGEWYLDVNQGVPYTQQIFVKAPNQIKIESVLKNEILETPTITELTAFRSEYNTKNRTFNVIFKAISDFGNIDLNIEVV